MDRKEQLIELIKARSEDARQIAEAAEGNGGYSAEDRQTIKRLLDEAQGFKGELDAAKGDDDMRRQLRELDTSLGLSKTTSDHFDPPPAGYGLGATVTASDEYRSFRSKFPEGRIPERARVSMDPVGIRGTITGKQENGPGNGPTATAPGGPGLISIGATAGAQGLVQRDYQGLVDMLGRYEVHIRDLVSVRTTTSDLIEYVRQLTRFPNAQWVAEATDLDPATFPSGTTGIKPMGGFDFEVILAPVETVAEWIPITKRALMDAAQLRGIIDDELRGDLRDAEELALLYGAAGIDGIDTTSGIQLQNFDTDIFTTTRRAKSLVRMPGFAVPTAYLINPETDEEIDLARDGNQQFFGNGPFGVGPTSLWGLPRVVSDYVRPDEAWLADWRRAVIWDRQQASISVSDSHADFFIRNLVAVLGEQRLAFGVIRPAAFVKIELA